MDNLIGLDNFDLFKFYCKTNKKYGLYYNYDLEYILTLNLGIDELYLAAPWIKNLSDNIKFDSSGFLIFDTKEELDKVYNNTVGDDGPTEYNNYNGPVRVYALTFDQNGIIINENT